MVNVLTDGPADSPYVFLFAHGAGGAMDTPFMTTVARGLAGAGIRVVRFEFPYMAARRSTAPDRTPVLLETWREAIAEQGGGARVAIGGKSLGGRMATMIAAEAGVRAAVCFGYPFHPPGKPQQLRTAHLETLQVPTLILQGTRDPFGTEAEVAGYTLSPAIRIEWLPDGDHSLKPRASSGATEREHLARAVACAAGFLKSSFPHGRHS
ncbi:MAG TPA: alpha/beta family hydrolase [Thermoanaerobaculia bacterium]|nr:alpha/beta family hydrolase [Thermoanaerobaculia bacterium]